MSQALRRAPVPGLDGVEVRELTALEFVEFQDIVAAAQGASDKATMVRVMAELAWRSVCAGYQVPDLAAALQLRLDDLRAISDAALALNGLVKAGDTLEVPPGE